MHSWGDEDFSDELFNQVEDAAQYIGENLRKWFRVGVMQYKEKFGTVRVYCHLGFSCFHSIIYPGYCWIHKWWPYSLDLKISEYLMPLLNRIVIPIQISGYRYFYKRAIQKWPHLREEIICCADYDEYLREL